MAVAGRVARLTVQGEKFIGKVAAKELRSAARAGVAKGARNRFVPDSNATGPHTVFRRDVGSGKVTHYETFRPQTNPRNPNPWESVKRFDGNLNHPHEHYNKITKQDVYTPHVHDSSTPGGIRIPQIWEIP
jgi:hypothetical protein